MARSGKHGGAVMAKAGESLSGRIYQSTVETLKAAREPVWHAEQDAILDAISRAGGDRWQVNIREEFTWKRTHWAWIECKQCERTSGQRFECSPFADNHSGYAATLVSNMRACQCLTNTDWQDEPTQPSVERKREVPMTDAQVDRLVDQIRGRPSSSYETNEQEMHARIADWQESRGWICGQPRGYAQCVAHGTLFALDGVCVDCEPTELFSSLTNSTGTKGADLTVVDMVKAIETHRRPVVVPLHIPYPYEVRETEDILDEAIERAEKMLPHGIECLYERNVCRDSFDVFAQCPHCGERDQVSDFSADAVDYAISSGVLGELIYQGARTVLPACISATCCDPLDRMVDGLRVRECLVRYEAYQRGDSGGGYAFRIGPNSRETLRPRSLTEPQMAAARLAWSSELKRKQQEAREKEHNVVCVDDDRWEP